MRRRVIAVRPEPGLAATLALARDMGIEAEGVALFEIRARAWTEPDPESVDALLVGSANAFLHGGPALARFAGKPVHAVGEKTAEAARAAGFAVAATGSGGLQQVLDSVRPPARLLRVAGATHVPLEPPEGVRITTVIAYESAALPMPARLAGRLAAGALVLLHSAEAARHFASESDRLGVARSAVSLAALAPRIAEAAGAGWRAIHVAPEPGDAALLHMVRDMVT
ncbi:uroporphyrinogen-III synthase [Erythrobacter sp. HL-111]|uniref:uroporphyrinogen-III synthase n=1 Tax=Erythrobacter sp. HL-111 TaxID=1798193 RepID=UPI0006DAB0BA|nr:uroporphyrinogen-III synthase [Erythrobacter sp. HL-111]KPP88248.1 MAG: uroporphyrinogen-III synthase HemD [Erythrobacteraceae bacterium HL-111]SDS27482.1 uroporphyrinogen-III synthase [Erythrobacter sp. HL-111]